MLVGCTGVPSYIRLCHRLSRNTPLIIIIFIVIRPRKNTNLFNMPLVIVISMLDS